MSEEFMKLTVNDIDFVILKNLEETTDKYQTFSFTTEHDGKKKLMLRLQSELVDDLKEIHGIDMVAEIMTVVKAEIQAELEELTA